MVKLLKWVLGLLVMLTLLVLLAVLIIPKVFNPNDYRDEIVQLVNDKTGRELTLDGDLSVSVFPWLGVKTQGLSFSQPKKIGGEMIAVETAQLRLKLVPLLSKRVEIDTIVLNEPQLRLVTLKDGSDSFFGLLDESEADTDNSSSDDESGDLGVAIAIEGVEINNAQVIIDNRAEEQRYEITGFSLNTGNLIGSKLASVSASGILKDSTNPVDTEFSLDAQAKINDETLDVQVEALELNVALGEDKITANIDALTFNQAQALDINGLIANWSGAQKATVSIPSLQLNLDKQTANISNVELFMGDLSAVVSNIVASKIIDAPKVSGLISVEKFNARKLIDDFGVDFEPASNDALKAVSMTASFKATKESASISNLKFNLDDSLLTGSAGVTNFDNPALVFDFNLNSLNLDNYLPEDEEEAVATEGEGGLTPDSLSVPMSVFRDINANGSFTAGQLISGGLELNDIDVKVVSKNGSVTITPKASLYDGKTDGQIAFSESAGVSTLKIKNEVDLVSLGDMLTSAEITDQLSGIGSLLIDVVVTEKNGVQSNEGTIKLQAKDGALKGIDLQSIVQKGYSTYKNLSGSTSDNEILSSSPEAETKFAEVLGTFYLKDNKVTNDDFSMKAPFFRVGGAGDIFLDSETLDYAVDFSIVESIKGQSGEAFEKLKGLTIPIKLSGSFESPSYTIGWTELYKSLAKQKVEEEKAKLLKDKLGLEGEDTSTKGILKQLIQKEIDKDSAEGAVGTDSAQDSEPKSSKDQIKDELKNTLLKGLFN